MQHDERGKRRHSLLKLEPNLSLYNTIIVMYLEGGIWTQIDKNFKKYLLQNVILNLCARGNGSACVWENVKMANPLYNIRQIKSIFATLNHKIFNIIISCRKL